MAWSFELFFGPPTSLCGRILTVTETKWAILMGVSGMLTAWGSGLEGGSGVLAPQPYNALPPLNPQKAWTLKPYTLSLNPKP